MPNELVIHIGDRKTGSTSIQEALANQAWQSPQTRICYPVDARNHNALAFTLFKRERRKHQARRFAEVAGLIAQSDAEIAVISSEGFESVNPEELKAAIEQHLPQVSQNLRVIGYVRPHVDRFLSSYAETVKLGRVNKAMSSFFDTTLENGKFFYHPRFRAWGEVFGTDFTLRPFLRETLYQGNVVKDFLQLVLRGQPFSLTGEVKSNASLPIRDLALVREMHTVIRSMEQTQQKHRPFQDALGERLALKLLSTPSTAAGRRLDAPKELLLKLQETYQEDARLMDERFFEGTPLQDALCAAAEREGEQPAPLKPEKHFEESELRSIRVLSELLGECVQAAPAKVATRLRELHLQEVLDD